MSRQRIVIECEGSIDEYEAMEMIAKFAAEPWCTRAYLLPAIGAVRSPSSAQCGTCGKTCAELPKQEGTMKTGRCINCGSIDIHGYDLVTVTEFYTCATCGYSQTTPCNDAREKGVEK